MAETLTLLTTEQKQAALEQALRSQTFARSEMLRSFLKYIGEMEMAGRGGELSEYMVGVEALGRSPGYSPGEDSSVRNRAHALRQKLQEFYNQEQPATSVRIDLPKGSYCPIFVAQQPAPVKVEATSEVLTEPEAPSPLPELSVAQTIQTRRVSKLNGVLLPFLAGVLLTSLVAGAIWFKTRPQANPPSDAKISAAVREIWGPLLTSDANVQVCVATPMQARVRPYQQAPASVVPNNVPLVEDIYRKRYKLLPENHLYLSPTHTSPLWGDAAGAMTVALTLTAAGASFQIIPERVVSLAALRGKNVILLGSPEYSPAVAQLIEKAPFTIGFAAAAQDDVIINRQPRAAEPAMYTMKKSKQDGTAEEVYGLITVLPSEGTGDAQQRTVILSGLTSAGIQAAAEYFASPHHLLEWQTRLQTEGQFAIPNAYQIVIKATANAWLPLSFQYETHRLLPQ